MVDGRIRIRIGLQLLELFGAEKKFAADFRAEKSQEGLRRKRNDRRGPINLGPRILKIVVFVAEII